MVLTDFTSRSAGHASSSSVMGGDGTSSKIQEKAAVIEKAAVSLHETRASTREAALASLIGALEGFVPAVYVGWWCGEAILRRCCVSIKKGSAKEACLALRAVALLAVTLGPGPRSAPATGSKKKKIMAETYDPLAPGTGSKKIMAEIYPLVSRILEVSLDTSVVLAAVECLAVVAFVDVAAENMDDTELCMRALWSLICPTGPKVVGAANKTNPTLLAAAVSAWTLVLTTTTGWKKKVSPGALRDTAVYLASLLHSNIRAVRMAAGEALAVIIELKMLTRNKNTDLIFSDIEARASDLAIEAAGKCVDKTNFLDQKDLFKYITSFLAGGKPPKSSVRTSSSQHGLVTTSTWMGMVRLNFLRRFLGGGFLNHLQGKGLLGENGPMRKLFVIKDDEVTGKLSAARSKQSIKKDTRIAQKLDGGVSMEAKKEAKQQRVKKDRQMSYEIKHGSSDL